MIKMDKSFLVNKIGCHVASETHIRIHISEIPYTETENYYSEYHGEVLLIVIKGNGIIKTTNSTELLRENDQLLLTNSEPFFISAKSVHEKLIVEYCWLPGPYKCEICDENNK